MPKVNYLNTNFTAGEISPRLYGRVDIARYQNGAKTITNAWPVIHGGVMRRHGTKYVAETKDSTKASRLIPFVFSVDQTFVLEFGHNYIRFYKSSAQVLSAPSTPYEITTTYTEAQLPDIAYAQGADTIILVHPDHPPRRLRRFGDTNWTLDDIAFDPMPYDEVGHTPATTGTLSASTVGTGRTLTAGAAAFLASDVGRIVTAAGGVAEITAYSSSTGVTVAITTAFAGTSLASGGWTIEGTPQTTCTPSGSTTVVGGTVTLTLSADGWRSTDVGRFVEINDGLVEITTYTSALAVDGRVIRVLASTTAAPADAWILKGAVWSSVLGYPRAVTFYQQRLILAGSESYPGHIFGSVVGELFNFTLGTDDDDAFSFEIASGEVNPVRQLVGRDAIIAITERAEFTVQGGIERPLAPTNVQIKQRSTYGTDAVRPVVIRDETIFVQRAGRKVRALKYDSETGGYIAPDVAVLAEHITEGGITEVAYQQEYDALLWCVRGDGSLVTCSFDRDQDVVGWALQSTAGLFESVAVIPVDGRDQVWCIVQREIDGSDVRYVEIFDPDVLLDCAITGTASPADATWSGLDHLEGETVQAVGDGVYLGEFTVDGGEITLTRAASDVVIGLAYESSVTLLTPEMPGLGSFQGNAMSVSDVVVRFLETVSCKVNGDVLSFRNFGSNLLDQAPEPFSGVKSITTLGWKKGNNEQTISQDEPMAWHVLSVVRKLTVND